MPEKQSLWQEFKAFAFKGNLIELAVAVVLGTAFTGVVNSLVANVIMPVFGYIMPANDYQSWMIGKIEAGKFLGAVVNFVIISIVLFIFMVKVLGALRKSPPPGPAPAPTTKPCPLCLSSIPIAARKCAFCTSDLPV